VVRLQPATVGADDTSTADTSVDDTSLDDTSVATKGA
jgi:hypothetical protein